MAALQAQRVREAPTSIVAGDSLASPATQLPRDGSGTSLSSFRTASAGVSPGLPSNGTSWDPMPSTSWSPPTTDSAVRRGDAKAKPTGLGVITTDEVAGYGAAQAAARLSSYRYPAMTSPYSQYNERIRGAGPLSPPPTVALPALPTDPSVTGDGFIANLDFADLKNGKISPRIAESASFSSMLSSLDNSPRQYASAQPSRSGSSKAISSSERPHADDRSIPSAGPSSGHSRALSLAHSSNPSVGSPSTDFTSADASSVTAARSSKSVLEIALRKAQIAVDLDTAGNEQAAIDAYTESVQLLTDLIERIEDSAGSWRQKEEQKLQAHLAKKREKRRSTDRAGSSASASHAARVEAEREEEERSRWLAKLEKRERSRLDESRKLKDIHDTYTTRIRILQDEIAIRNLDIRETASSQASRSSGMSDHTNFLSMAMSPQANTADFHTSNYMPAKLPQLDTHGSSASMNSPRHSALPFPPSPRAASSGSAGRSSPHRSSQLHQTAASRPLGASDIASGSSTKPIPITASEAPSYLSMLEFSPESNSSVRSDSGTFEAQQANRASPRLFTDGPPLPTSSVPYRSSRASETTTPAMRTNGSTAARVSQTTSSSSVSHTSRDLASALLPRASPPTGRTTLPRDDVRPANLQPNPRVEATSAFVRPVDVRESDASNQARLPPKRHAPSHSVSSGQTSQLPTAFAPVGRTRRATTVASAAQAQQTLLVNPTTSDGTISQRRKSPQIAQHSTMPQVAEDARDSFERSAENLSEVQLAMRSRTQSQPSRRPSLTSHRSDMPLLPPPPKLDISIAPVILRSDSDPGHSANIHDVQHLLPDRFTTGTSFIEPDTPASSSAFTSVSTESVVQMQMPDYAPPPRNSARRPYYFLQQVAASMDGHYAGAYLTPRLFLPTGMWSQSGIKLVHVEAKVRALEGLLASLESIDRAGSDILDTARGAFCPNPTESARRLLRELEAFDALCDDVQATLAKKLPYIDLPGGKKNSASGLSTFGSKLSRSMDKMKGKNLDAPETYVAAMHRICVSAQVLDKHHAALQPDVSLIPQPASMAMGRVLSQATVKAPPQSAYDDLGMDARHLVLSRLQRSSSFFGSVICRIMLTDLGIWLDKYSKRAAVYTVES